MTERQITTSDALLCLAFGKIVRAKDGVPIYHHPKKGMMHRTAKDGWVQFGANLAEDTYEVVLDLEPPA